MVVLIVTLGQNYTIIQYNIGEKLTVLLYIDIDHHVRTLTIKQNQETLRVFMYKIFGR